MCLYFIHLCDGGTDIGPTKKQCNHVQSVCDVELKKLEARARGIININDILSMCSPGESPLDAKNCNISINSVSNQTLHCSEGFFYEVNKEKCTPECAVWTPYSTTKAVTDVLTVLPAVIGAIAGIAVLLTSALRHQKL